MADDQPSLPSPYSTGLKGLCPRCGEGKLFGRLRRLGTVEAAEVLRVGIAADDIDPEVLAGSPVFELLVEGAAWQRLDGESWVSATWSSAAGARRYERLGPSGERRLV